MKAVSPYLNFNGNTGGAFNFYKSVSSGEFAGGVMRFKDFEAMPGMDKLSEEDLNKVGHISLPLGGDQFLMGTDALRPRGTGDMGSEHATRER